MMGGRQGDGSRPLKKCHCEGAKRPKNLEYANCNRFKILRYAQNDKTRLISNLQNAIIEN